jgi:hypothetical protein
MATVRTAGSIDERRRLPTVIADRLLTWRTTFTDPLG